MRAKIVRIGNSRGLRLPKPLIDQVGLGEVVNLRLKDGGILITPESRPRMGWAEGAAQLRAARESIDSYDSTRFDREDWHW